ncbi:thioredoxin family protein [Paenibacillus bovis]|uniref:Thiol reductase thioredoxin n=1 Tax=Paenibacillus bovis TaxID=1616788 RepID=A0A172ZEV8_9BACL|nr:thioredoxin family protein [Paenibacillus bovis]ANF95817.1 thiol reductase thioredoxin [Paenibacillus bovis]
MKSLNSVEQVREEIQSKRLQLLLLKMHNCSVCEAVQPQTARLLEDYPQIAGAYIYVEDAPELASEYLIFTSPVLILFYEGKEVYRAARFIRFAELEQQLEGYASLLES